LFVPRTCRFVGLQVKRVVVDDPAESIIQIKAEAPEHRSLSEAFQLNELLAYELNELVITHCLTRLQVLPS